ncbi:MAG TPA: ribosome-associated translation inhibitor RaiA [Acidobacteriaceae bacterium]|jgi:putative sigma-54 modulation protein
MQVEYTGRQVAITPSLRRLAEEGLDRVSKVVGRSCSAHVILTEEKYRHTAEVTVQTKFQTIVGLCESSMMETALRDALAKAELQAIKHKGKFRSRTREPKDGKASHEPQLSRPRNNPMSVAALPDVAEPILPAAKTPAPKPANGNGNGRKHAPVRVHSPSHGGEIAEPHVVHCDDCLSEQPMSLDEAVKESELRDKDVFVFRDPAGDLRVLHRRRDGVMELIALPC